MSFLRKSGFSRKINFEKNCYDLFHEHILIFSNSSSDMKLRVKVSIINI